MSRVRWIDQGNDKNNITQAMEIAFIREDAESNNLLLNNKTDVITSAIAALVFNQNIHGIGSAPSTVPLSASNSPIGGGASNVLLVVVILHLLVVRFHFMLVLHLLDLVVHLFQFLKGNFLTELKVK